MQEKINGFLIENAISVFAVVIQLSFQNDKLEFIVLNHSNSVLTFKSRSIAFV